MAVTGDDGQQVIEIVRHAAGQPAQRFHFAGLAELFLQNGALGDIDANAADHGDPFVFDDGELVDEPGVRAIGVQYGFHPFRGPAGADDHRVVLAIAGGMVGGPDVFIRFADDRFRADVEEMPGRLVVVDVAAVEILNESDSRQVVHERGETLFTLPEDLLLDLSLADIDNRGDDRAANFAGRGVEHAGIQQNPATGTVLPPEADLVFAEAARSAQKAENPVAIGGIEVDAGGAKGQ